MDNYYPANYFPSEEYADSVYEYAQTKFKVKEPNDKQLEEAQQELEYQFECFQGESAEN